MEQSNVYPGKDEAASRYREKTKDNLFSYKRMRQVPIRKVIPKEEESLIRKSFFSNEAGVDIRDKYKGELFTDELGNKVKYVKDYYDKVKLLIEPLKEECYEINFSWHPQELIELAYDSGAKMAGLMTYEDPYFKREMCALTIAVEMEQPYVKQTPSINTLQHVFTKYAESTHVVTKMAEALAHKGIYGQPVPSLSLFDPICNEFNLARMAVESELGIMGKHYLLLTPEYGPRVRLAAIFMHKSKHWDEWKAAQTTSPVIQEMQERCDNCTACIKMCPPNALANDDVRACSEYFVENANCGICMMVCPLGKVSGIKSYEKKLKRQSGAM